MIRARCTQAEAETFHEAARRDGFDTLSAWMLWLMRGRDKETREREQERGAAGRKKRRR